MKMVFIIFRLKTAGKKSLKENMLACFSLNIKYDFYRRYCVSYEVSLLPKMIGS